LQWIAEKSKLNESNIQSDAQVYNDNAGLPKTEAEKEKITNQVF
jgi:hypothetical protein